MCVCVQLHTWSDACDDRVRVLVLEATDGSFHRRLDSLQVDDVLVLLTELLSSRFLSYKDTQTGTKRTVTSSMESNMIPFIENKEVIRAVK